MARQRKAVKAQEASLPLETKPVDQIPVGSVVGVCATGLCQPLNELSVIPGGLLPAEPVQQKDPIPDATEKKLEVPTEVASPVAGVPEEETDEIEPEKADELTVVVTPRVQHFLARMVAKSSPDQCYTWEHAIADILDQWVLLYDQSDDCGLPMGFGSSVDESEDPDFEEAFETAIRGR